MLFFIQVDTNIKKIEVQNKEDQGNSSIVKPSINMVNTGNFPKIFVLSHPLKIYFLIHIIFMGINMNIISEMNEINTFWFHSN